MCPSTPSTRPLSNRIKFVAAVVADGSTGDLLVAELGQGAWRLSGDATEPLTVSDASQVVSFEAWPKAGPERDLAARVLGAAVSVDHWDVRCFSTSLALAYVATGQLAGSVFFAAPGLVHIAAGTRLAAEAGGHVTDILGRPWNVTSRSVVCAAHEALGFQLRELISRVTAGGS